jgi:hypothetical protein
MTSVRKHPTDNEKETTDFTDYTDYIFKKPGQLPVFEINIFRQDLQDQQD